MEEITLIKYTLDLEHWWILFYGLKAGNKDCFLDISTKCFLHNKHFCGAHQGIIDTYIVLTSEGYATASIRPVILSTKSDLAENSSLDIKRR